MAQLHGSQQTRSETTHALIRMNDMCFSCFQLIMKSGKDQSAVTKADTATLSHDEMSTMLISYQPQPQCIKTDPDIMALVAGPLLLMWLNLCCNANNFPAPEIARQAGISSPLCHHCQKSLESLILVLPREMAPIPPLKKNQCNLFSDE